MTQIIRPFSKSSKKRKPNAKQRELANSWNSILSAHSKPLFGNRTTSQSTKKRVEHIIDDSRDTSKYKSLVVVGVDNGTKPIIDPLAEAKAKLACRIGQAYNKGALQYLSDDEMAEQRTGNHRRR